MCGIVKWMRGSSKSQVLPLKLLRLMEEHEYITCITRTLGDLNVLAHEYYKNMRKQGMTEEGCFWWFKAWIWVSTGKCSNGLVKRFKISSKWKFQTLNSRNCFGSRGSLLPKQFGWDHSKRNIIFLVCVFHVTTSPTDRFPLLAQTFHDGRVFQ